MDTTRMNKENWNCSVQHVHTLHGIAIYLHVHTNTIFSLLPSLPLSLSRSLSGPGYLFFLAISLSRCRQSPDLSLSPPQSR